MGHRRVWEAIVACDCRQGFQAVRICIASPRATAPSGITGLGQRDGARLCDLKIVRVWVGVIDEDDCQWVSPKARRRLTRIQVHCIPCFGISSQTLSLSNVFLYE